MSRAPNRAGAGEDVAVVGAGLVGSMTAALLAKRGFNVTLYESRPDPRVELQTVSDTS